VNSPLYQLAKRRFEALSVSEQRTVRIGLIGGAAGLLVVALIILQGVAHRAETRIAAKRADLAYIESVLPELTAAPPAVVGQSLVAVIDDTTTTAGLKDALKGTEPSGTEGVVAHFEGAPLPALLTWLVRVQREYSAKITAATLDKGANNGEVNATVTLVAP